MTPTTGPIVLLGIESSCDDTAAAVVVDGQVRANVVSTQLQHTAYGGVVPEVASRQHQANIWPVVQAALDQAGVSKHDLTAIAYTQGPGLIGSLLVGACFARGASLALGKPLVAVNHLQGHLHSLFAEGVPRLPLLCLTVSGGHTLLHIVRSPLEAELVGRTLDDAAGEAFDKIAKLLGFDYPGGPHIDRLARLGNPKAHKFPPLKLPGFDFSFSGLKTAVRYYLRDNVAQNPDFIAQHLPDLCASVQHRIVTTLLDRFFAAAHHYNIPTLGIVGGVSANSELRRRFMERCDKEGFTGHIPPFALCTDNAAMIALAGYYQYLAGDRTPLSAVPFAS